MKSRILYINPIVEISGAETSLLLLLEKLDRRLFYPIVILPGEGPLKGRLEEMGIEAVTMRLSKIDKKNPIPYLKTVYALSRFIRDRAVDIVHCNMGICNQYALAAARLNGVPVVSHTRNILNRRAFKRMFLGFSDALIANSKAVAGSYSEYMRRDQKVHVIHNGVDLREFSSSRGNGSFRRKFGLSEDMFLIGQIARIHPCKGQNILLKAVADVTRFHPNIRTLLAGDVKIDNSEWHHEELKRITSELGLDDRVFFTGFTDDIVGLYADLDLLVLPSLHEPFGRTLIEAMAMGVPVIASAQGGPLEIVEDGVTGFLVPVGDPVRLAEAILKVLKDKELAKKLGENGRERVRSRFTIEENVRKTEKVYSELIAAEK
ncbi:glycosyltransferase [Candidatus Omnitrophota bacterium]